jgi:hypothetical protein
MTIEWATSLNYHMYKNVKDCRGKTPLEYAFENQSFMETVEIDTLKFLMPDVCLQNHYANSALHALLQNDFKPNKRILQWLIESGGQEILNQQNLINKDTPLMLSLKNPYVDNEIIQSLISNLNPNIYNSHRQFPIHMAVKDPEIVSPFAYEITEELLQALNYNQHKNDQDRNLKTPLYYALENENTIQKINIIKMLISDENIHFKCWPTSYRFSYPIHVAAANVFVTTEIIDLLDHEKYKNTRDGNGDTPLPSLDLK